MTGTVLLRIYELQYTVEHLQTLGLIIWFDIEMFVLYKKPKCIATIYGASKMVSFKQGYLFRVSVIRDFTICYKSTCL